MAVIIATISAPNATIATLVAKAIGRRFSLTDANGAPRDGTKADLEKAVRDVVRDWVEQDQDERAAKADRASRGSMELT